jgi:HEAT repeat protein
MFQLCLACLVAQEALCVPEVLPYVAPDTQRSSALIGLLDEERVEIRQEVITALVKVGPPAVPALASALRHEDRLVRAGAASALGWIGREAAPAVGALRDAMRDDDKGVRIATIDALGRIGQAASPAIVAMVALGDDDPDVRSSMRDALRSIGGNPLYVSQLAAQLPNGDEHVGEMAAYALGLVGPEAFPAVPALAAAIGKANRMVRLAAIRALADIGPLARPAIIPLVKVVDDDPAVRTSVRDALGRIGGGAELVPELIALLAGQPDAMRISAAYVLGGIGAEARMAVLPLAAAAGQGNDALRFEAARALRKILP